MYTLDQVIALLKSYRSQGLTIDNLIEILEYDSDLFNQPKPIQSTQRVPTET